MNLIKRMLALLLAALMCLCLFGCGKEDKNADLPYIPNNDPILPGAANPTVLNDVPTAVYASTFENTVVLAAVPVQSWSGYEEPTCNAKNISNGGRILCNNTCGKEHEEEIPPITKVIVLEDICPKGTGGWFRDMVDLQTIVGVEKIHMQFATNSTFMFAGCIRLGSLDINQWDMSNVTDMTGMFDDCPAMDKLPEWYTTN